MTYSEFREKILNLAYPDRIPQVLVPLVESFFSLSLSEVQLKIPYYRSRNIQTTDHDSVSWDCGVSSVPLPEGEVKSVWLYVSLTDSCPTDRDKCAVVEYFATSNRRILDLREQYQHWVMDRGGEDEAPNTIQPTANPWYSIFQQERQIWLYPPVGYGWGVKVQWEGVNKSWADSDDMTLFEDVMIEDLLRLFVLQKSATFEGCSADMIRYRVGEYNDKLADVIYWARSRTQPRLTRGRRLDILSCGFYPCTRAFGTDLYCEPEI